MIEWLPVSDDMPKNRTVILAWCDHEADPTTDPDYVGERTTYGLHFNNRWSKFDVRGPALIIWRIGGHDYRTGVDLPDWWYLADGEWKTPVNPLFWSPINKPAGQPDADDWV